MTNASIPIEADNIAYTLPANEESFDTHGIQCERVSEQSPKQKHQNKVEVYCLISGAMTYLLGTNKVELSEGMLGVFWSATPHQIINIAPGSEYYLVTVPLQEFLTWRLSKPFVQAVLNGRLITEHSKDRVQSDLDQFTQWELDLKQSHTTMHKAVVLEVHARLSRLDTHFNEFSDGQDWSGTTDRALSKVEQMASFIATNYTSKLSIDAIAESVELHPNYAMNLFQKSFGTTLINYLTQHRVSHAQRLLTTTSKNITDIAYLSGFQSISRFNSAFQAATNCSPRTYRQSYCKHSAEH